MINLNPFALGWQELWLRILVITLVVSALMLVALTAAMLMLSLWDVACWVARKARGIPQGSRPHKAPLKPAARAVQRNLGDYPQGS